MGQLLEDCHPDHIASVIEHCIGYNSNNITIGIA